MKKAFPLTALCALALVVTACASRNNGAGTGFGGSSSGSGFRTGTARTLSPDAKLALGTIKLEGTAQAVDARTAAKLLPLWQLMVQLHSSTSSAPQEVTAVLDAIQAAMTPQQVNAVDGMSFTTADAFSLLQNEAQANSASGGANSSGANRFSRGNRQGGGGQFFFAGPPPGGEFGGGFGGGGFRSANGSGSSSTTQLTAAQQAEAAQARENAISSLVENQLIRLLETKLGSQPG